MSEETVNCPSCGEEIVASQINYATILAINSDKEPGDLFLGIVDFEDRTEDCFYICPKCGEEIYTLEDGWITNEKRG